MPKNNYERTSANLLRTGSIGGNSKFPGLGPADPIQEFLVNRPLLGHLNGPRPRPSTSVRLFCSLINTMCLDAFLEVPADQRLLKPTDNKFTDLQRVVAAYAFNPMGDPILATRGNDRVEFWTLPPGFAIDFREGSSAEELESRYKERWMRPSKSLNYVYIQVKDACGHWYLAVMAF
ncbi:hypothetical protein HN51_070280 [Arachis hypogaea]